MITASPIEPTTTTQGGLGFHSPPSPSEHGLTKTKIAIESLQEELIQAKRENDRLKKSGEAKAQQLRELQQHVEAQASRLAVLDGRLAQGQGALSAACTAAQSKDLELKSLKEALDRREQLIKEQAATVARLDKLVNEGEIASVAGRERESMLNKLAEDLKIQASFRDEDARQRGIAAAATADALQSQLKKAMADFAEERSLREKEKHKYTNSIAKLEEKLGSTAAELIETKKQSAAVVADSAAGAASLRGLAEQLVHERKQWEQERSRLLQECQRRLDEAERWLDIAAKDADNHKRDAAAAVEQATHKLHMVELEWARKAEELVTAARQEERQRFHAEQAVVLLQQSQGQHLQRHSIEDWVDARIKESHINEQEAMNAEYERLEGQVTRCLEALAEKVERHQSKTDKRQGNGFLSL